MARLSHRSTADLVAIVLGVGVSTALNVITFAVVYSAVVGTSDVPGGLSENATQILTGWGGGMIGVLGAYVGYAFGRRDKENDKGTGTTQDLGEGS